MKLLSCAFTGHRPKKFPWGYKENMPECIALKQALNTQITLLAENGITEFLSGMAEGTDTWAALAVLALREKNPALKLHCVLPCESQADKWSAFAQERYVAILSAANKVTYVRREYTPDCMLERNRYLVDHVAVLLAVYNGGWRGGTAATVRYAQKSGRGLIIIDPANLQVTYSPEDWANRLTTHRSENMERFIYTKREMQIIQTKRPIAITDEEFLALYRKAFLRDKIEHIIHLGDVYPEIENRVFSDEFIAAHNNPADQEDSYPHPILCPANRNTEAGIKDLVCYLTGRTEWTKSLRHQLCTVVPYRLVFNYWLDEFVRDYETAPLWENFFLGQEELSRIIEKRRITCFEELIYRTINYFENLPLFSHPKCRNRDRQGEIKTSLWV